MMMYGRWVRVLGRGGEGMGILVRVGGRGGGEGGGILLGIINGGLGVGLGFFGGASRAYVKTLAGFTIVSYLFLK